MRKPNIRTVCRSLDRQIKQRQIEEEIEREANRIMNFLAAMPCGSSTCNRAVAKKILEKCGINFMACGTMYIVKAKNLGCGVYHISLEPRIIH